MRRDATRTEAMAWCRKAMADFVNPIYPTPRGWMWTESKDALILQPQTYSYERGITSVDCRVIPHRNVLH